MTDVIFESRAWQLYEKLPRPALRWICLVAAVWVCGLCDVLGFPLEGTVRGVVLTFVAAVYGLRGMEKLKAQREYSEPYYTEEPWDGRD